MEKFLKTASVVVTGYSGYVGTATSEALKEKGYTVIGFDKQDRNDTRNIFKLFLICLKKPNAIGHSAICFSKHAKPLNCAASPQRPGCGT
jgi:nucleoside-diphosphate-sugar epimerase